MNIINLYEDLKKYTECDCCGETADEGGFDELFDLI